MKKHILIVLVLVGLTPCSRASDLNPTGAAPANNPALASNNALELLAMETSNSQAIPGAVLSTNVSTNKPVWESSITLGATATAGNVNSALATGNFQTHKKTPFDEWNLGMDAVYGEVSSIKNSESLHGFVQYNHLYSQHWYGYARADA
ncbi:MAG TPA: DUF481 domain-containing protein, partial [Verrucomicrobiae bacterium]|nr:DUF481 domain-containing protein [Verrucomicrobiae bacterium]